MSWCCAGFSSLLVLLSACLYVLRYFGGRVVCYISFVTEINQLFSGSDYETAFLGMFFFSLCLSAFSLWRFWLFLHYLVDLDLDLDLFSSLFSLSLSSDIFSFFEVCLLDSFFDKECIENKYTRANTSASLTKKPLVGHN